MPYEKSAPPPLMPKLNENEVAACAGIAVSATVPSVTATRVARPVARIEFRKFVIEEVLSVRRGCSACPLKVPSHKGLHTVFNLN
jgi:hypothetical protein